LLLVVGLEEEEGLDDILGGDDVALEASPIHFLTIV